MVDLNALRAKLIEEEDLAAHRAGPHSQAPPPVLNVIEFDFLRKRRGFELVPALPWSVFSEFVSSIEQEMLLEAADPLMTPSPPSAHNLRVPTLQIEKVGSQSEGVKRD